MDWNRTTSLITGASSGIGLEFARELAARGSRVVLVARDEAKLRSLAAELVAQGAVEPVVIPMDLSREESIAALKRETDARDLRIDALINNAGFSNHGAIAEIPSEDQSRLIRLNVLAMAGLVREYLPGMIERHRGAIVNLGSIVSFHPLPTQAAYAASKAFVLSYTESLWQETRGTGVEVLALCPGVTSTDFYKTLGKEVMLPKRTPRMVVVTALRALESDKMTVVDGWLNALQSRWFPRIVARRMFMRLAGAIMGRMYR